MIRRSLARLRAQDGMGLVELLAAMLILTIAISALLTAFTASVKSLTRSGQEGTALSVADRQMEAYRALPFACVTLNGGTAPSGCPAASGFPNPYSASQTPTASDTPDHHTYTVTTAITYADSPTNLQKQVIVSVTSSAGTELGRASSLFSSVDFPASTTP